MHFDCICERCGKSFSLEVPLYEYKGRHHLYCSRSCANARPQSNETKAKISLTLRHGIPAVNRYCVDCHQLLTTYWRKSRSGYCHKCAPRHRVLTPEVRDRLRLSGLKSAQVQKDSRRSKNEIAFYEKCKEHFKNVSHNLAIFNGWDADIIINDIRVAVLWNGPWHYRKITEKHSVLQVQNRDKLKILEIKKCGYIPYIIADLGKYNPEKVENEFQRFKEFVKELEK